MKKPRTRLSLMFVAVALVMTAAVVSTSTPWSLDFAQYKGEPRPQPGADDEFRFAIVGDRTGGAQWGLMPQTFREINQLDPDFVVSVGDLIDGYGEDEETINGIWDEFDKTEMPVLKVPFVYIPGNHDIWNSASKRVYEKRYGPRFKSFNYRGLHFITLNTQENAGRDRRSADGRFRGPGGGSDLLGEEQIKWLQEDIERNRHARRILIFMHQPIWGALEKVYPMVEGLPVNVFAGHYHKYSYQEKHGIPHIICSATAAYIPEEGMEAYGRFRSYLLATVRGDQFNLALIRLGGVLSPKYIMEQDQGAVRKLADACAIWCEGDGSSERGRIVFRNPMPVPVKLQVVRATRGSSKHLFDTKEPSIGNGEAWEQEIDWQSFADSGAPNPEYRVVYRFDNAGGEPTSFDFPIEAKVRRVARAMAVSSPPAIDGDLSDWSDATWQTIGDRSQVTMGVEAWRGPQDLSAQFAVEEDENNIYVAVRVADDAVAYNSRTYEGDSVELFTANAADREISFHGEKGWRGLTVTPFSPGSGSDQGATSGTTPVLKLGLPNIWGGGPGTQRFDGGQAAYVRDAHQYSIEIALPRSELGWDDTQDAIKELDIAINDRDSGSGRETQLAWSGIDRNVYSSRYYGRIRLP